MTDVTFSRHRRIARLYPTGRVRRPSCKRKREPGTLFLLLGSRRQRRRARRLRIAIGSGTDVAVESAGIILVQSNPLDVVRIIKLSRASYTKMIQNIWWAAGYNIVALPLAAGILAPFGILLSPAVGALFMSLSTVIVAINAQLLRRVELG